MNRFETDDVYIVAEIGQNHNGDLDVAKMLIDDAYEAGCSAVKSAKRDLTCEMTTLAFNTVYESENSFGNTYGDHRDFLELSEEQHRILKKYTNNRNMDYFLSVCDIPSLEFALTLNPPLVKIPSKEINNIPLLKKVAVCGKPVVLSMGLARMKDFDIAVDMIPDSIKCVCTSQYPCEYDNINLRRLNHYTGRQGFSSHNPDPLLGISAYVLGATYIEYHITLDMQMKGSDHICSLEMSEFSNLIDGIMTMKISLGDGKMFTELPYYLEPAAVKLLKHKCKDGVYRT